MTVCSDVNSGCNYPEGECLGFCSDSWQWSRCPHAVKKYNAERSEHLRNLYKEIVEEWSEKIKSKESKTNVA